MPVSRTGHEAFESALTAASRSSTDVSAPKEFAEMVYSFYERALADDDVSDPWSEQKVKDRAEKEWKFQTYEIGGSGGDTVWIKATDRRSAIKKFKEDVRPNAIPEQVTETAAPDGETVIESEY